MVRVGWKKHSLGVLVGKSEGKRPLGNLIRKLEDNIKMGLRGIGYEDVVWIYLARDGDKLQILWTC
jgi:hypothetical protein